MVLVVAVHEVLHDGGALKQPDGLAVLEDVREGRDAAVGVDLEEPGLLQERNCQLRDFLYIKGLVCLRLETHLLRVLAEFNVCSLETRVSTTFQDSGLTEICICTSYLRPSSSRTIETLMPLGV